VTELNATRKTPLYSQHIQLKAKIVNFGGWEMPISYEGVLAEHKTVRSAVGLFDVSHMGEIRVVGQEAALFLNSILVNNIDAIANNQGQYSALCNEQGGVIDDLIVYRLTNEEFFLCVNASNSDKDFSWIESKSSKFKVQVRNESELWSQIAIQGPLSVEALKTVLNANDAQRVETLPYTHILRVDYQNQKIWIARTGYTGEKGFEIYLPNSLAVEIWVQLLERNQKLGIKPIGLGARDTLRLEATYLLYGNDMDETVSPLEADIAWAVKFTHNFIGKDALLAQKEKGLPRKIFAFKMIDSGIPRHGMDILQDDRKIGVVTSGSVLPTVGGSGGMALLSTQFYNSEKEILIDIRGTQKKAVVVPKPLYKARVK
jgi:aminomethyltransferase